MHPPQLIIDFLGLQFEHDTNQISLLWSKAFSVNKDFTHKSRHELQFDGAVQKLKYEVISWHYKQAFKREKEKEIATQTLIFQLM